MKTLAVLFIVWLALIIFVVAGVFLHIPDSLSEGMKDTLTAIGIGVTAVGTLMTAAITFLISKRSIEAAAKLEKVKGDIVGEIEKKRSDYAKDLATLNRDFQKELQTLKQNADRQTEIMKATTLSREIESYEELFAPQPSTTLRFQNLKTTSGAKPTIPGAKSGWQRRGLKFYTS